MKKTFIICGLAYTIMCLGVGTWMIVKPEAYGMWIGKMMSGLTKVLEGGDK